MTSHYAVVDGAAVPGLLEQALHNDARVFGLLRGDMVAGLASVAPYLVPLSPGPDALTRWLLRRVHEAPVGMFCEAVCGRHLLLAQLRRLLTARLPDGNEMLFRYYDPEVFALLVPGFDSVQLQTLFAPARAWYHLDHRHRCSIRYSLHRQRLKVEKTPWRVGDWPPGIGAER